MNPTYRDAGCPSQCWGDSSYATLEDDVQCPAVCLSEYAAPGAKVKCPSACNFSSNYVTLGNYYKYMNMPAETAARLYTPSSKLTDFYVRNPRIVDFAGTIKEPTVITSKYKIPLDATGLMRTVVRDKVPLSAAEKKALRENRGEIAQAAQQVATAATQVANQAQETAQVAQAAAAAAPSPATQQAAVQATQAAQEATQAAAATQQAAAVAPETVATPAAQTATAAANTAQATTAATAQTAPQAGATATQNLANAVNNLQATVERFFYM